MARVREMLERSRKSLMDGTARQRLEGSTRQLLERSRSTVAHFVGAETSSDDPSQEVLAGVCSSVALRDLNIVDSLLEQLEQMEADEQDPDALAKLYKLDHLATRLRRNSENLRVLAGREAGGGREETAPLVDVIRAGMSAIEDYPRVSLGKVAALDVVGFAADDVSRMLAEVLDNATTYSPPTSEVTVGAHLTEQGSVLVRVEDAGIGLPPARLSTLNEQLSDAPKLDSGTVQHMGLAVVRRLAAAHNIRVWMARRAPHGTTASVLLPAPLVRSSRGSGAHGGQAAGSVGTSAGAGAALSTATMSGPRASAAMPSSGTPSSGTGSSGTGSSGTSPVGATASGLPQRVPGGSRPQHPASQQADSQQAEAQQAEARGSGQDDDKATTVNGLPRRVPRSLKDPGAGSEDGSEPAWPPPRPDSADQSPEQRRVSHERLLADLGEFAEGEQAAQAEHRAARQTGTVSGDIPRGDTGIDSATGTDSESDPPPEGRDK